MFWHLTFNHRMICSDSVICQHQCQIEHIGCLWGLTWCVHASTQSVPVSSSCTLSWRRCTCCWTPLVSSTTTGCSWCRDTRPTRSGGSAACTTRTAGSTGWPPARSAYTCSTWSRYGQPCWIRQIILQYLTQEVVTRFAKWRIHFITFCNIWIS